MGVAARRGIGIHAGGYRGRWWAASMGCGCTGEGPPAGCRRNGPTDGQRVLSGDAAAGGGAGVRCRSCWRRGGPPGGPTRRPPSGRNEGPADRPAREQKSAYGTTGRQGPGGPGRGPGRFQGIRAPRDRERRVGAHRRWKRDHYGGPAQRGAGGDWRQLGSGRARSGESRGRKAIRVWVGGRGACQIVLSVRLSQNGAKTGRRRRDRSEGWSHSALQESRRRSRERASKSVTGTHHRASDFRRGTAPSRITVAHFFAGRASPH